MYVYVRLLNGFKKPLVYRLPSALAQSNLLHQIIQVPLQKRLEFAQVIAQKSFIGQQNFTIRDIHELTILPADQRYQPFIQSVASYYQIDQLNLLQRLVSFLRHDPEAMESLAAPSLHLQHALTAEQHVVYQAVKEDMNAEKFQATLLHGVTGSGKTEVYLSLIKQAIAQQKSVFVLAPEISVALHLQHRLSTLIDKDHLFGFHSASRPTERKALWQRLVNNEPLVVVGIHLPVLLPCNNLGLIIIDEEHEIGYQEKKHPKINSKEVALMRAQHYNIPILLGSATPSISSLYATKQRNWRLCTLANRFGGSFVSTRIVKLDKNKRRYFFISAELQKAIEACLERKEQAILFLNRRGHSFFVQCENCNQPLQCIHCSVSLTFHEDGSLRCHYCSYAEQFNPRCPQCNKDSMIKRGIGTQQLVQMVKSIFPHARIGRADLDVSSQPKKLKTVLQDFKDGNLDILIGTQTIAKGLHFPRVSLVGVIWADVNLHFPTYNAQEVALQQLIQVIGRAGREGQPAEAIIQTIEHHQIYNYLDERTYPAFYETEMISRQLLHYPPAGRLAEIELIAENEAIIEKEAALIAHKIRALQLSVQLLGPSLPPVAKIKNAHRRRIYLKGDSLQTLIECYKKIKNIALESSIFFTPNPLN